MNDDLPAIDLAQVAKRYWSGLLILPVVVVGTWFLQSQQTQPVFSAAILLQPPPSVALTVENAVQASASNVMVQGPRHAIVISAVDASPAKAAETVTTAYPAILEAAKSAVDAEITLAKTVLSALERELAAPSGDLSDLLSAFDRSPGFRDRISILEEWKSVASVSQPSVTSVDGPMSLPWAIVLWAAALVVTFSLFLALDLARNQRAGREAPQA